MLISSESSLFVQVSIRGFSVYKGLSELTDRCEITEGSWLQLKGYNSYLMVCISDLGLESSSTGHRNSQYQCIILT